MLQNSSVFFSNVKSVICNDWTVKMSEVVVERSQKVNAQETFLL
jgi:hypothetical protein